MSNTEGLSIESINCLKQENALQHNTSKYETDALIIRRGEQIKLVVNTSHSSIDLDQLQFEINLSSGYRPSKRNGSLVQIERVGQLEENKWGYHVTSVQGGSMHITISVPCHALVAKYNLSIVSYTYRGRKRLRTIYDHFDDVYILFNPWYKDDEVYMEDAKKRNEYVLNDEGLIYWGGKRPKHWFFGQFEDMSLRCAFFILEKISVEKRDTAREVARAISALVNESDDDGILVGNWSDDYSGGRKPWEWTGSAAILARYLDSGGEPVKFGQCWVFSGVVTAVMRSLGIPTRSVTNYDSAHDADDNLTFDKFYDYDGTYLDDESDDSCWNFHVWNDCWMVRPDLPPGYGGWQAMDATPQELSSGSYRAGPASLKAIKEGVVNLRYDAKFIFAEVNADTVSWRRNKATGEFEAINIDPDNVGRYMSTKAVGDNNWERHDITNEYKHAEKSVSERIVVKRALKISKNPVVKETAKDITFKTSAEDIDVGETAVVKLSMKNTKDKARTIDVIITAHVVRYNGVALEKLPPIKGKGTVKANATENLEFKVERKQYFKHLDENPLIRFSIMAMVNETDQIFVGQKVVDVDVPALVVSHVDGNLTLPVDGETKIRVEIPQPTGFKILSNCELVFDGSAVNKPQKFQLNDMKVEGKSFTVEKTITTRKNMFGRNFVELLVTFNSKQLSGLQGNTQFAI